MPIVKPIRVAFRPERKTAVLQFPSDGPEPMECDIRGGIAMPMHMEGQQQLVGFAVLAGLELRTKKITIYEQRQFSTIEHVLAPNGTIEYEGISSFFNQCWTNYFGIKFYTFQKPQLTKKYRTQVYRSEMIKPKPQFLKVHWGDSPIDAHQTLQELSLNRKLLVDKDSPLSTVFAKYESSPAAMKKFTEPEMQAFLACLVGYQTSPWRDPERYGPG